MTSEDMLSKLSDEQKASLLCGAGFFSTRQIDDAGIKRLQLLDGGTGMNFEQLFGDIFIDFAKSEGYSFEQFDRVIHNFYSPEKLSDEERELRDQLFFKLTEYTGGFEPHPGCYPPGILLGSTWNPEVVYETGRALGLEALMYKVSCLLGTPNVNLLREPRNGRFFEGYSEDPYVAGKLGKELVRGVQSAEVAANVKHFAANNLEINRSGIDERISKRALEELYLPAFKECVTRGKAATVMAAYPKINGVHCTENSWLLREVLRKRWNFDGLTMTDWGACVGDSGDSVEAGIDLLMPGPWEHEDEILQALQDGRLSRENFEKSCANLISLADKYAKGGDPFPVTYEEYIKQGSRACYNADAEGFILLKNRDGLFPLADMGRISLYGADEILICGSGSAQVITDRAPSLKQVFGDKKDGDVAVVIVSIPSAEGTDRKDLKLPLEHLRIIKELKSKGKKICLVLNVPGPVELNECIDDADAIFLVYYPGMEGARALYDIMSGKLNPSGKLTVTFPERYEDTPSYLNYPDGCTCVYGEDIYVGYRGYEKRKIKPLFSFGFGLSYTDFELDDAVSTKDEFGMGETAAVSFTLKNTGDRAGSQVVQLYVEDPVSMQQKPVKELRAFGKYYLLPGQSKRFCLEFKIDDIGSYSEDYGKFLIEDGIYNIHLGFSSEDIRASLAIRLTEGSEELSLGINSRVLDIMMIPHLRAALEKDIRQNGENIQDLISNERYTPHMRIKDIYKNAEGFVNFVKECRNYLKG